MTARSPHTRYLHQALIYDSDEQFLGTVLPFLHEGVAAGEPVLVAMGGWQAAAIRRSLGAATDQVHFLQDTHYRRPSSTMATNHELLRLQMSDEPAQIRMVGALPRHALEQTWGWWARYESGSNLAYADFPVWQVCAYDARCTRPEVLADVRRTHPHLSAADGDHRPSAAYEDPAVFLERPGPIDPIEATTPLADLVDPSLRQARAAAERAGRSSGCGADRVLAFVVAVNEAVTNVTCHGVPPARVRLWAGPDRMVATVTDLGTGPQNPLAGLVRTGDSATGGLGLWLTHESCDHVTFSTDEDGFTLRLVVGDVAAA